MFCYYFIVKHPVYICNLGQKHKNIAHMLMHFAIYSCGMWVKGYQREIFEMNIGTEIFYMWREFTIILGTKIFDIFHCCWTSYFLTRSYWMSWEKICNDTNMNTPLKVSNNWYEGECQSRSLMLESWTILLHQNLLWN